MIELSESERAVLHYLALVSKAAEAELRRGREILVTPGGLASGYAILDESARVRTVLGEGEVEQQIADSALVRLLEACLLKNEVPVRSDEKVSSSQGPSAPRHARGRRITLMACATAVALVGILLLPTPLAPPGEQPGANQPGAHQPSAKSKDHAFVPAEVSVQIRNLELNGPLPATTVWSGLESVRPALTTCALVHAELDLHWRIDARGQIQDLRISPAGTATDCVREALNKASFGFRSAPTFVAATLVLKPSPPHDGQLDDPLDDQGAR